MQTTLDQRITLLTLDSWGTLRERYKTEFAAAGAALLELTLAGRVDLVDGEITAVDTTPLGVPALDETLATVADRGPESAKKLLRALKKPAYNGAVDALVEGGILRGERHRALGLVPVPRYFRNDNTLDDQLREQLKEVVEGGTEPDERTAALALLASSAKLHKHAFPGIDAKVVKRRTEELSAGDWAAPTVRKAVEAMQYEMQGAVAAAAAGAAAGG